jgi:hypothetical protein
VNGLHLRILTQFFKEAEVMCGAVGLTKEQYRALTSQAWAVLAEHVKSGRPIVRGRDIPLENSILFWWNCGPCIEDMEKDPDGSVLWASGWTPIGFQMVCQKHGNIRHIDFEGMSHPSRGDNLRLIDALTMEIKR